MILDAAGRFTGAVHGVDREYSNDLQMHLESPFRQRMPLAAEPLAAESSGTIIECIVVEMVWAFNSCI